LLKIATFRSSSVSGGLFRMGIGALPFLLAMLLQVVFGLSPFASGLLTFASAAGAMFMKFTVGPIVRRFGFRTVLVGNGLISALVMMSYALFGPSTSHALIILALLTGGFFRSLQFTALGTIAYADIPDASLSNASSFASMAQQLFMSLGVGLAALILHVCLTVRGSTVLIRSDFSTAFVILGGMSLLSSLLFLRLEHRAGHEVSGGRTRVAASASPPVQAAAEAD
jgi:MFS family permease